MIYIKDIRYGYFLYSDGKLICKIKHDIIDKKGYCIGYMYKIHKLNNISKIFGERNFLNFKNELIDENEDVFERNVKTIHGYHIINNRGEEVRYYNNYKSIFYKITIDTLLINDNITCFTTNNNKLIISRYNRVLYEESNINSNFKYIKVDKYDVSILYYDYVVKYKWLNGDYGKEQYQTKFNAIKMDYYGKYQLYPDGKCVINITKFGYDNSYKNKYIIVYLDNIVDVFLDQWKFYVVDINNELFLFNFETTQLDKIDPNLSLI